MCGTGGARYQRDGARCESVASRCAVVGSTASGRSSHPGRPPDPTEQKLPYHTASNTSSIVSSSLTITKSIIFQDKEAFHLNCECLRINVSTLTRALNSTGKPFSDAISEQTEISLTNLASTFLLTNNESTGQTRPPKGENFIQPFYKCWHFRRSFMFSLSLLYLLQTRWNPSAACLCVACQPHPDSAYPPPPTTSL